jgi:hypothetical protein
MRGEDFLRTLMLLGSLFILLLPQAGLACGGMQNGGGTPGMGRRPSDDSGCPQAGKFEKTPGASLFQTKGCTACHTLGGGDKTGPDLDGLFQRRNEKWVHEFLQDPEGMAQTDSKARALKEEYGVQMPPMDLSPREIDQIVEFLKKTNQ